MDIYLIIWIIMQYYFINFVAETISVVATGSVFNWLQGLFDMLSFLCVCLCVYERERFLSPSPLSGTIRCSRLTHVFSESPNQSFLPGSLVLFWRLVLANKICEVGGLIATRVLLFLVLLIGEQGKVSLCTKSSLTYAHIKTYFYNVVISVCVNLHESILISATLSHSHKHCCNFLSLIFCNFPLQQKDLASQHPHHLIVQSDREIRKRVLELTHTPMCD